MSKQPSKTEIDAALKTVVILSPEQVLWTGVVAKLTAQLKQLKSEIAVNTKFLVTAETELRNLK